MGYITSIISYLERSDIVRVQVLFCISVLNIHNRTREHYQKTYGIQAESNGPSQSDECYQRSKILPNIKWRNFPQAPRVFVVFRAFSTIWMIYILIKYILNNYFETLLGRDVVLKRPINCYLPGKMLIDERLNDISAALFTAFHLAWRLAQTLIPPYRPNLVYFMLLERQDLELVYARLEHNSSFEVGPSEEEQLTSMERLVLDTMCYRIRRSTRVIFKLRANRTRQAHLKLRRMLARLTLLVAGIYLPIATTLTFYFPFLDSTDAKYLSLYPGCDPQLQEQLDSGQLGRWSITLTNHRLLAFSGDMLENLALWIEDGLATTIPPAFTLFLAYDLFLNWRAIDEKIDQLAISEGDKRLQQLSATTISRTTIVGKSSDFRSSGIAELIREMDDFFNQYKTAGKLLELLLNEVLVLSLLICSSYTYYTKINEIDQLPLDIIAIFSYAGAGVIISCFGFLMVHMHCMSTYPKLCSLMAYDHKKHDHNYGIIMKYYSTRKTCIKLLNHYPFLPTTVLTVIGWTFSRFFIISELIERKDRSHGRTITIMNAHKLNESIPRWKASM